jgi:cytoplasmic iron level regulating protein YaaA (DUF328/UPF0246 family)
MNRLMIISCSNLKSDTPEALPAIDRYKGVTYKVIKKARREGYWSKDTHIFIVSAKYGLISEHTCINTYDQKMTNTRAIELQNEVSGALDSLLKKGRYGKILLNLGEIYMQSISLSHEIERVRQTGSLQEAFGGIGLRQKQMKAWIIEQYKLDLENLYL